MMALAVAVQACGFKSTGVGFVTARRTVGLRDGNPTDEPMSAGLDVLRKGGPAAWIR